jgi:hypothetical protein
MSESGFDLSELTEVQQQALLASASEVLQVASGSPRIGGDYDSGPTGIDAALNAPLLGELANIPDLEHKVNYVKQRVEKDDATGGMSGINASGNIVFGGGVPVGGWTALNIFPNGAWNFSGHLHVSGAPSYDVGVTWVVTTSDGQPTFSFPITGRVHGTFEAGSRNFDWNRDGTNGALAAAWPELAAGYRWRWQAGANIDFGSMTGAVVQAIGAVGAVIALL